ncbi:MAG: cation:proton antiporter, partial [Donghicola eburneus]
MAVASEVAGLGPVNAIALVGALGVGSQWLAWRLRMPAIVLMLLAGLIVGPGLGIFDPARDIGPLMKPMISIAVAIILFEGGLTLDFHSLREARVGVRRLVFIGAPLGWALSAAALHYTAGLGWAASSVFGGIMVVTGPTVIAPLLRQARLQQRPAKLLQWEAIVNDPVGALAAVLAFTVVLVMADTATVGEAVTEFSLGIGVATILGLAAGWGIAQGFTRGVVPEYMKVPVLFTVLVAVFAASDAVLHESGLLAVTVMGVVIANAELPSYDELRRFKEHATVLLVSGVFILLAANMDRDTLFAMEWSTLGFIIVVILLARPVTVMVSLLGSDVPMKERILIALTGPRGVVLVAVAGLFAERLVELGYDDASKIPALAFALVAATVVLHGFTLAPLAGWLGLTADRASGVLIVGGSRWSTALAKALQDAELPVLVVDRNRSRLRSAREAGVRTYY